MFINAIQDPHCRVIDVARGYAILQFPVVRPRGRRSGLVVNIALLFDVDQDDVDRDLMIARLLGFLYARRNLPHDLSTAFDYLIALAEMGGRLTVWYDAGDYPNERLTAPQVKAEVEAAVAAMISPTGEDDWEVTVVPIHLTKGVLPYAAIPPDHPLHVIPTRYRLGLRWT